MTNTKHTHHDNYDLQQDIEKIKEALAEATQDLKGRAGEILSHSVDDIKEQSTVAKEKIANYTAEQPFKTLGITLLAGIAIGYFLRK